MRDRRRLLDWSTLLVLLLGAAAWPRWAQASAPEIQPQAPSGERSSSEGLPTPGGQLPPPAVDRARGAEASGSGGRLPLWERPWDDGPREAPPDDEPPPATEGWLDETHAILNATILWPAVRLDRFFGDERAVDLPRPRSFVRWRNDVTIRDDGTLSSSTSAHGEFVFPSLERRLERFRLTLSGGASDTGDRFVNADAPSPDAPRRPAAGLRYALLEALATQADAHAGLLFSRGLGWYARLRLRHVEPLGDALLARTALAVFWQTTTGYGTRQDLELERPLLPWLGLRLSSTGAVTEVSRGWEWVSELSLYAAVSSRTGLILGGSGSGATAVGPVVEVWRVHVRTRRDVLRRWLFLELEPAVKWTRPEGGGRRRERSVLVRLEVQFDGAIRSQPAGEAAGDVAR